MPTDDKSDEMRQPRSMRRRVFLCGVLGVVAIGVIGAVYEATEGPEESENPGVTMANYRRLTAGMSYQSVVDILGAPGVVQERSSAGGITSVTYLWVRGGSGANLSVKFNDDKLAVKTQFELK